MENMTMKTLARIGFLASLLAWLPFAAMAQTHSQFANGDGTTSPAVVFVCPTANGASTTGCPFNGAAGTTNTHSQFRNSDGTTSPAQVMLCPSADGSTTIPCVFGGGGGALPAGATNTVQINAGSNLFGGVGPGTTVTTLHGNVAGPPSYQLINLGTDVTNTLPASNGGTGITAFGSGVAAALALNVSGTGSFCLTSGSSCGGSGGSTTIIGGNGIAISGSPCSTSCTASTTVTRNDQIGTSYPIATTDGGAIVTGSNAGAIGFSIPVASTTGYTSGFGVDVFTRTSSTGLVTLTPASGTVAGQTSVTAQKSQLIELISDSSNYDAYATVPLLGANTVLGNVSGTPNFGVPLTATQLTTLCNVATASLTGCTPALPNVSTEFYNGVGGWTTPAGSGSGTVTTLTAGSNVTFSSGSTCTVTCTISASGGTGSPGGSTTQVQFNLAGAFSGDSGLTYAGSGGALTLTGTSATQLSIGANGASNPVFQINDATSSVATGLLLTGAATGGVTTLVETDSGANSGLTINAKGTGLLSLGSGNGGSTSIDYNTIARITVASTVTTVDGGTSVVEVTTASASAANVRYSYVGAADTTLTASTEAPDVYYNLGQTRQHSTGGISLQRDFRVTGSLHTAVGASTLTNDAVLAVDMNTGTPTNATITNMSGFYEPSVAVANTTNSYGLNIAAATGATNNYAAFFTGDIRSSGNPVVITGSGSPTCNINICDDTSGEVAVGTAATSVNIAFSNTKPNKPNCTVTNQAVLAVFSPVPSTTGIAITLTGGTGTLVNYHCIQD